MGFTRYNPIIKDGPSDCIASVIDIVDKMDHLISTNNRKAIVQLKTFFGLKAVTDDRDFARAIAFPCKFTEIHLESQA
jgi:hypothetical protein